MLGASKTRPSKLYPPFLTAEKTSACSSDIALDLGLVLFGVRLDVDVDLDSFNSTIDRLKQL